MKKSTQDDFIRTALRVPPEIHARVHEEARASGRTFNAQLVHMLNDYFDRQDEDQERRETGGASEKAIGIEIGLNEPQDRAAALKVLQLGELMLLRRRVEDLGGRDAVLDKDRGELMKELNGPKIVGTESERVSHFTRIVGTYPLTTILTSEELGKVAERVVAIQNATNQAK